MPNLKPLTGTVGMTDIQFKAHDRHREGNTTHTCPAVLAARGEIAAQEAAMIGMSAAVTLRARWLEENGQEEGHSSSSNSRCA